MCYSQGDGVYTSLVRISYRTHMLVSVLCLGLCYFVLPMARSCAIRDDSNKVNVYTIYTCRAKVPAPIQDHLIDHLV